MNGSVMDLSTGVDLCTDAVERALAAGATDAEVGHTATELFEVNHETTEIGLVRSTVSDDLSIAAYIDGAKGTSTINGRSRDDVERGVAEAIAAARADRPDPANVIAPGEPSELVEIGDREPDRDAMVATVSALIERLAADYPSIRYGDSSNYAFTNTWRSFANSGGVVRQERRSGYRVTGLFTGKDGTRTTSMNYSSSAGVAPFDDLLEVGTFRTLLDETVRSFDPEPVPETFVGDVILTPGSLPTLVDPVIRAISGMALLRGTSVFDDALGDAVASPRFSLTSTPCSGEFPLARGFDDHGIPARDLELIVDGALRAHLVDWYTSHKLGRPMTASVTALRVAPGTAGYDELISRVGRGIVLGRFSGGLPNENLDFSGVAKNSFYVEDGCVVGPISETMVTGNFRDLLRNIREVGRETVNTGTTAYPYLLTSGATISTK